MCSVTQRLYSWRAYTSYSEPGERAQQLRAHTAIAGNPSCNSHMGQITAACNSISRDGIQGLWHLPALVFTCTYPHIHRHTCTHTCTHAQHSHFVSLCGYILTFTTNSFFKNKFTNLLACGRYLINTDWYKEKADIFISLHWIHYFQSCYNSDGFLTRHVLSTFN